MRIRQMEHMLEVKRLKKYFNVVRGYGSFGGKKVVKAIDDVSFAIEKGETLGLVGESGCGKSTLARTIIRLHEPTSGSIVFENEDITRIARKELNARRRNMQIIFQDPYASLNPRLTVGEIVSEPLVIHKAIGLARYTKNEIREKTRTLLEKVGLSANHYNRYPHEFSGGQRQRIGIARALALHPKLVLCDEPVSALDVSIQAQIINLLQQLQEEFSLTYLFISHDLSVVRHISDRVAVMYLGKILEIADYREIYENPIHPYTKALLSAVPIPDPIKERSRKRIILQGDIYATADMDKYCCNFSDRCNMKSDECACAEPVMREVGDKHFVYCINCG